MIHQLQNRPNGLNSRHDMRRFKFQWIFIFTIRRGFRLLRTLLGGIDWVNGKAHRWLRCAGSDVGSGCSGSGSLPHPHKGKASAAGASLRSKASGASSRGKGTAGWRGFAGAAACLTSTGPVTTCRWAGLCCFTHRLTHGPASCRASLAQRRRRRHLRADLDCQCRLATPTGTLRQTHQ